MNTNGDRVMQNFSLITALILVLACSTTNAHQMTEKYIPVGMYPQLDSQYTTYGTIEAVNTGQNTVTISGKTAKVTDKTLIWLDRSQLKQKSVNGSFGDLREGLKAEFKLADPDSDVAKWVKVQITQ